MTKKNEGKAGPRPGRRYWHICQPKDSHKLFSQRQKISQIEKWVKNMNRFHKEEEIQKAKTYMKTHPITLVSNQENVN